MDDTEAQSEEENTEEEWNWRRNSMAIRFMAIPRNLLCDLGFLSASVAINALLYQKD